MPLSLNNRKDIVADSISINTASGTIDVLERLNAVQGSASDTYDRANIDGKLLAINTNVNNKQDKIILGTTITGSQNLFNITTSK